VSNNISRSKSTLLSKPVESQRLGGGRQPELDGLRGIAILAVTLFHGNFGTLPGGYAGVDVFFVLSGYLIVLRLAREPEANFSVGEYFVRRLRRLVPALLLCLAATTLAAFTLYTPHEFSAYGDRLRAGALFAANIHFWQVSGYFDPNVDSLELLHLWSLGVEAQWYLIAPLFFIFSKVFFKKNGAAALLLSAGIVSFVFWVYCAETRPSVGFYMLPPRLWEFALGAMAAMVVWPKMSSWMSEVATIVGLALIVTPMVLVRPTEHYSTVLISSACFGTALVIVASRMKSSIFSNKLLSNQPILFFGRISYALYLWHWPLLIIPAVVLSRPLTGWEQAQVLSVAVVLSWLSTTYLERRILAKSKAKSGREVTCYLGVLAACAVSGAVIAATQGMPERFPPSVVAASAAQTDSEFFPTCLRGGVDRCGAQHSGVAVWGDSHAEHWIPGIENVVGGARVLRFGAPGCPPLPGAQILNFVPSSRINNDEPNWRLTALCLRENYQALKAIEDRRDLTVVVLAAAWQFYSEGADIGTGEPRFIVQKSSDLPSVTLTRRVIKDSLRALVARLKARGLRVVLIGDTPAYRHGPATCVARALMLGWHQSDCARDTLGREGLNWSDSLLVNFRNNGQASVILPSDQLCSSQECTLRYRNTFVYRDTDHLTKAGSIALISRSAGIFRQRQAVP
jgi:peptidoglycan/LPS O-acetylase OafA/YrhL